MGRVIQACFTPGFRRPLGETDQEVLRAKAKLAEDLRKKSDALEEFVAEIPAVIKIQKQILEMFPHDATAHIDIGNAYYRAGHLAKARSHYEQAIKHDPREGVAYHNIGILLFDKRLLRAASTWFRKAIEIGGERSHYAEEARRFLSGMAKLGKPASPRGNVR